MVGKKERKKCRQKVFFSFFHNGYQHFLHFPHCLQKASCPGSLDGWLVVLGFNATLTAKIISWQSVTHMCFLAFLHQHKHNFPFQSHRLLFSYASAEVRSENMLENKVASTWDQTPNHQVISLTGSPLSQLGGAQGH